MYHKIRAPLIYNFPIVQSCFDCWLSVELNFKYRWNSDLQNRYEKNEMYLFMSPILDEMDPTWHMITLHCTNYNSFDLFHLWMVLWRVAIIYRGYTHPLLDFKCLTIRKTWNRQMALLQGAGTLLMLDH